jgi:pimeloyl-ACP methyl ester carboxylesterase
MHEYVKLDQSEILARLFYPRREPKTPLPDGALDKEFEVESGIVLGCRFYLHDAAAPNIIYFHGNGEIVCDHDDIGKQYNDAGCNLLVMSYRGYGWSSGTPTVRAMFDDGRNLFLQTTGWLNAEGYTGPVFLMGRSLGSACAIDLALFYAKLSKGLVIESGFADTLPLLEVLGISMSGKEIREEECFGNKAKIARVALPTLILHGARDQLIPVSEAEKLQANSGARNKQLFLIPGADHNTMIYMAGSMYFQTIRHFIDTISGAASWRVRRKQHKSSSKETS